MIIHLKPRSSRQVAEGYLWVFSGDIAGVDSTSANAADVAQVVAADGTPLGTALYNPNATIAARMLVGDHPRVDTDFFTKRFTTAQALRNHVLPNEEAYRLVFSEAELLSGLIIDRYNSVFAVQTLTVALERRLPDITEALKRVFPETTAIVAKNMASSRTTEALELYTSTLWGECPPRVDFQENGVQLSIDLLVGQKTGYFLDQKLNRQFVGALSKGKSVLDMFCNVGGFALNAALNGASNVVGVDSSQWAVDEATHQASINGFEQCRFVRDNAFDFMHSQVEQGAFWDVVVVDPPSFTKRRATLNNAKSGYASLNRSALKLLKPGGFLVSASCTQLVSEYDLLDIIYTEAARIGKTLRLVYRGQQSPDHPVLLAMPETQYLKFLVFEVVDVT